jgi:hypothetical protein
MYPSPNRETEVGGWSPGPAWAKAEDPIFIKTKQKGLGHGSGLECLPNKCKALSSNPVLIPLPPHIKKKV